MVRRFDEPTRYKLRDFLIEIMKRDSLSDADVAFKLFAKTVQISWLKTPSYWKIIPEKVWTKLQEWQEEEERIKQLTKINIIMEKKQLPKVEIEHDIPIPEHAPHHSKFPFAKMEIGDSFSVPLEMEGQIGYKSSSIGSAAGHFRRRFPKQRFLIRTLKAEGIIRCWRVEDVEEE